jgi:hypothetical protein
VSEWRDITARSDLGGLLPAQGAVANGHGRASETARQGTAMAVRARGQPTEASTETPRRAAPPAASRGRQAAAQYGAPGSCKDSDLQGIAFGVAGSAYQARRMLPRAAGPPALPAGLGMGRESGGRQRGRTARGRAAGAPPTVSGAGGRDAALRRGRPRRLAPTPAPLPPRPPPAARARQMEGATLTDGRSACVWDTYVKAKPWEIRDGSNANVACDFYRRRAMGERGQQGRRLFRKAGGGAFGFASVSVVGEDSVKKSLTDKGSPPQVQG